MSLTSPFLLAFSSRLCTLPQPSQIHSRIEGWIPPSTTARQSEHVRVVPFSFRTKKCFPDRIASHVMISPNLERYRGLFAHYIDGELETDALMPAIIRV
jgi:hypothetical protein